MTVEYVLLNGIEVMLVEILVPIVKGLKLDDVSLFSYLRVQDKASQDRRELFLTISGHGMYEANSIIFYQE